jgi:hypothetical protein
MSLADDMFQALMDYSPMQAAMLGVPGWEDGVGDLSPEGQRADRDRLSALLDRAETDDTEDPVTLAVIRQQGRAIVDRVDARLVEHSVGARCSPG